MKAIVYTKNGSLDGLQLMEVSKPEPKEDQVLVKVHAASANALDYRRFDKPSGPGKVLGADIAWVGDHRIRWVQLAPLPPGNSGLNRIAGPTPAGVGCFHRHARTGDERRPSVWRKEVSARLASDPGTLLSR